MDVDEPEPEQQEPTLTPELVTADELAYLPTKEASGSSAVSQRKLVAYLTQQIQRMIY